MEPKIESKITYDDRRKELTHITSETKEATIGDQVIGEVVITSKGIYKEQGIRKILKDLSLQRTSAEQKIKQMKDSLKEVVELTPELKKLEEDIQAINDFNKNKKTKLQLEAQESDLKKVNKDLQDIKTAIGTRLKL